MRNGVPRHERWTTRSVKRKIPQNDNVLFCQQKYFQQFHAANSKAREA